MAVKPEISTYYWGRWDRPLDDRLLPFNPKLVLEAIGVMDMGDAEAWRLEEQGDAFTLTQTVSESRFIKQIHVERKALRIKRIAYLDENRTPLVVADLTGHRVIAKAFAVPTVIRITAFDAGEKAAWITLKLKTFRTGDLTAGKFKRPPERGFDQVTKVNK